MSRQAVTQESDILLLPFLETDNEAESTSILTEIISTHAVPIIESIIKYKLRVGLNVRSGGRQSLDAEDMRSEVILRLLKRLQALKVEPDRAIRNFRSYVAAATYHTCDQFLRQKYPQRWQLKNKLRYVLKQRPIFALWQSDEGWLCGLADWQDRPQVKPAPPDAPPQARRSQVLLEGLQTIGAKEFAGKNTRRLKIEDLLLAVFKYAGSPIELDDLVAVVSDLWGISDQALQAQARDDQTYKKSEPVFEAHRDVSFEIEIRNDLESAWAEICKLPTRQRAALLLNLRDSRGRSALLLIPITGIATIHQIAEALSMPAEQLAVLWNRLPLDDQTIAGHLGVTRQQVINLRKSARERLARRMKSLNQA